MVAAAAASFRVLVVIAADTTMTIIHQLHLRLYSFYGTCNIHKRPVVHTFARKLLAVSAALVLYAVHLH